MSIGLAMSLLEADHMGCFVTSRVGPFCETIEVAGSTRRRCPVVNDLEIVCIPHRVLPDLREADLFGHVDVSVSQKRPSPEFIRSIENMEPVKGSPLGKYTRRIVQGIMVDIFIVTPETWALQLFIRTGPADFVHRMASLWHRRGYQSRDAMITHMKTGQAVQFQNEEQIFEFLGQPYLKPEERFA